MVKRVKDPGDWLEDFEIEYRVLFAIREDDPYYDDESGDNLQIELNGCSVPTVLKDKEGNVGWDVPRIFGFHIRTYLISG